jgi:DNA-binding beta-propeller fold protein YncE
VLVALAIAIPWLLLLAIGAERLERHDTTPPPTNQVVVTAQSRTPDGSYSYVLLDGGFRVYDIGNDYALVKSVTFPDAAVLVRPRGVAADAHSGRFYASYNGPPGGEGYLVAYDLQRDRVAWTKRLPIDSFSLTTDGRKLYMPCGEGRAGCDYWTVLDARTGDEITRIPMHVSPHNTIATLDGDRVYLASSKYDRLAVVDPATDEIVSWIGPFRDSIRPFTVNHDDTLVFVTVDFLSGFEVARTDTGEKLFSVEVAGFPVARNQFPTLPVTQSHGIALTPDERELWVADDVYDHIHVFDVTGLPEERPRQIADIPLADSPKWINFTRDGRDGHISTGEIIDRRTRKISAVVEASRYFIQIDWAGGEPVAAYSRYGLGYAATGS